MSAGKITGRVFNMQRKRLAKLSTRANRISARKARTILHDGVVRGKPITEKQRRFFGAMSNKKRG